MSEDTSASAPVARWNPPLMTMADQVMATLERVARDDSISLDRLERLVAMQREMLRDDERRAFNAAMAACKAELPQVPKDCKNSDNNSKYASLGQMGAFIDKIIAKHGFSTSFNPVEGAPDGFLRVECVVAHAKGFERHYRSDVPVDAAGLKGTVNKTPIHAWKSTQTYARRTLTEMIFDVKSFDDDDGNEAGRATATISVEQGCALAALIAKVNGDPAAVSARVLAFYSEKLKRPLGSIEELPAKSFDDAERWLKQVIAAQAKGRKP
jgi:hypothetical protein